MNRKGRLTRGRMRFSAQYQKAIEWEKLFLGICDILGSNTALNMSKNKGKDLLIILKRT